VWNVKRVAEGNLAVGDAGSAEATRWYLASVATFMIPAGIQMVLVPYLLAIELNQPAARYGLTQMAGQLPMLLFLLFGGWLADRVDGRRLLIALQALAIVVPLILAFQLWRQQLSEPLLVLYAMAFGLVSAFAIPARDGLLKRVAGKNVQRMVTLAIGVQFATQMIGQALAGRSAQWGPIGILLLQCLVLAAGVLAAARLPPKIGPAPDAATTPRGALLQELNGGLASICGDAAMRATFLLTIGMGIFFGGTFLVLIPLTIRDLYGGGAPDIATGFIAFGLGTVLAIVGLTRAGGLVYPGRALVIVLLMGCGVLAPILLAPPEWAFYLCIFVWGIGGGIAMSMSRTILQERAAATHQSRTMAAFMLATVGGGPIGSMIMGFAVSAVTVRWAVLVPMLGVTLTTIAVSATHSIWQLRSHSH
jgi:MFS family permease